MFVGVAGCAAGDTSGDDDDVVGVDAAADGSAGGADAAPRTDAAPEPDAVPLKGFGEPCLDKSECESGICILAGIGGICTETCVAGSCPMDFGCVGVFGAIEPDEVADVCVPASTQICTTCVEDTECSLVGADLCLEYPDGKKFCAQDCTKVECPSGYTCTTVDVGGTDFEQCIPDSGACDCNDSLIDATEPCGIDTPFGTCDGLRTCLGATGWSDCEPPSPTDVPDETFTDDDCDGIDGDIDGGIFVAAGAGVDSGTCGLVHTDPCATINHGLTRAAAVGRSYVYVRAGTYDEIVAMRNGIHVYGGYDANWQRDARTEAGHAVVLSGGLHSGEGQYVGVLAHDLSVNTILGDVIVDAPDAMGAVGASARSSYGIHVANASDFVAERLTVNAGDGAVGTDGSDGGDAPFGVTATAGMNGATGGNAGTGDLIQCDNTSRGPGGARGTNACPAGRDADGGGGAAGGTMDTGCDIFGTCIVPELGGDCTATAGFGGANADFVMSPAGLGGGGGAGDPSCLAGIAGNAGTTVNGAAGTGAAGGDGFLSGDYWYAFAGAAGGTGQHGSGGGGGGGSGGCSGTALDTDSHGAGGGGGGAGGCAATGGGGGGFGGGGSFGIFAVSSTVTATDCLVNRGNGGGGGDGGRGGRGQSGGDGGDGGLGAGMSQPGGTGGDGAHGGHGGGGGGGAGGLSFGIYSYSSAVTHSCTFSGGAVGSVGSGGLSAPTAPVAERDGNDGSPGATPSSVGDVGTCSAPGGC